MERDGKGRRGDEEEEGEGADRPRFQASAAAARCPTAFIGRPRSARDSIPTVTCL